jgi:general nucleoside transport system permease protein
MDVKIEKRLDPAPYWLWLAPCISLLVSAGLGALLFAAMGFSPLETLYHVFLSPLTSLYNLTELALKASPLIMIGIGLAAGFRAGIWNIGAEGQLIMGAIAGGGVALALHDQAGFWVLPVMALAGILGGMVWSIMPAFLKLRYGVNEILTSLMLTYVAALLLSLLVFGPWKDPAGFNFPQTRMFSPSATLPVLIEGTRFHAGILVSFLIALVGFVVMKHMLTGFRIDTIGLAPQAAAYAGFSQDRMVWGTLLTAGGLAGLAGLFEVAGPIGQLVPSVSPGYGFTAIIVAYLGRLSPIGIILAAFAMALSYIGGENAQVAIGLPKAATGLFQGLLLFVLLASDFLTDHRLRFVRKQKQGAT